jgi:hypothetical protein
VRSRRLLARVRIFGGKYIGFARQGFGRRRSVTEFRSDSSNRTCGSFWQNHSDFRRRENGFAIFNPQCVPFDLVPRCPAKVSRQLVAAMILIKQCQDILHAVRRCRAKGQKLLFKRTRPGCAAHEVLKLLW